MVSKVPKAEMLGYAIMPPVVLAQEIKKALADDFADLRVESGDRLIKITVEYLDDD